MAARTDEVEFGWLIARVCNVTRGAAIAGSDLIFQRFHMHPWSSFLQLTLWGRGGKVRGPIVSLGESMRRGTVHGHHSPALMIAFAFYE